MRRAGSALAAAAVALMLLGVGGARATSAAARPLKVGLVTQAASLGDRSAGHLVYVGLERAVKELGVTGRVLTPGPKEGFYPSLAYLARQRFDIVVAGFVEDPGSVDEVARRFRARCSCFPVWEQVTAVPNHFDLFARSIKP